MGILWLLLLFFHQTLEFPRNCPIQHSYLLLESRQLLKSFLNFTNKEIIFSWVLNNVGITRNEKAGSATKSALDLPVKVGLSYTDFKHHISQLILSLCNNTVANKFHSIKPVLGDWQSCRMDEVVLCHTHIIYTSLTKILHLILSTVSVF